MQRSRSRFPDRVPSSSYWGSKDTREPESEEKKRLLDVLEKFRNLRPYLNKRLKTIVAAGRERELADLVDDIKYYLNVMNDLIADEHHGIDTILGFIENVHEMIRTDPVPMEKHGLMESNDDDDDDYSHNAAPRSPSPSPGSPVGSYAQSQQPRRIPVERERNDLNNPFQDKDTRHLANDVWSANTSNLGFQYSRRSDVDMRTLHDIRALPDEVFRSSRPGHSVNNPPRRPSDGNMGSHDNFGRMSHSHSREDMYRDRNSDIDRRYDRNRESEFDYHRDRNNDRFRESGNFRERPSSSGWDSSNRSGSMPESSFDRHGDRSRDRRNNDPWSEDRDRDRRQETWFPDRKFDREREGKFERDSNQRSSDHLKAVPKDRDLREPLDESLFERRPTKPEPHANSSSDNMVHFNYNHGPPSKDPSPVRRVDVDRRDKDMRSPAFPPAAGVSSSPLVQSPSVPNSPSPLIGNVDPNVTPSSILNQLPATNISNMPNTFPAGINMNVPLANQNLTPAQIQVMMQGMAAMFHNLTQQQQQQGINPQQPGQQPTMTPQQLQQMNQLLLNSQNLTSPGANSPNLNLPTPNSLNSNMSQQNIMNQNINHPNVPNQNMNMGMGFTGAPNRFGGLLPTPPVSNELRFQNPTNQRMFRPQSDMHSPGAMNNFNSRQNINTNHSNMISQIRQKAQHHFNQRSIRPTFGRRDGPNYQNGPHGLPPHNQSFPARPTVPPPTTTPPTAPPKSSHLATNQMLAEPPTLDPRLNRANRNIQSKENPPKESQPHNEPAAAQTSSEAGTNKKRTENSRVSDSSKSAPDPRVPASAPLKKVNKVNKLSEFRKEVEKEGMIKLGDKKSKKPSFEDALLLAPAKPPVTVSKTPKRTSGSKDKGDVSSKDDQDGGDSGSHKKTMTDKEKTKTQPRSNSKTRNSKSGRSSNESPSASIVPRSSTSSNSKSNSKGSEPTSTIATPKLNFKIPKIKKPPPPVVEEIIVETPSSSSPKPSDSHSEDDEYEKETSKLAESNIASEVATSTTTNAVPDDTEDLIKTFILKSMSTTDVERLNTNPEVYNEIAKKLQEHLKKIVTDDKDDKPSSSTGDSTSSTTVDSAEQAVAKSVDDKLADTSPPTKKRCSKRRSDLEKLHDALKEMRFDSMLPLGPRRCTNKAAPEDQQPDAGATANESSTTKAEDLKQAEASANLRSTVDEVIDAISNSKKKPKAVKKKGKVEKKMVVPKKGPTPKKALKNSATKEAAALPKSGQTTKTAAGKKLAAINESDVAENVKGKRGRKRKLDVSTTAAEGAEDAEGSEEKSEETNKNLPPKRYLTRLQAKKIANPPAPEVQPRTPRTGWEKWNKKLALFNFQRRKRQEKNKKFFATFNASKIKLKLKKQLSSKLKTKLKRKIDANGAQPQQEQPSKKSRLSEPPVLLGPNSIVVNSGLGKIKLETDWVEPSHVKAELDLSLTEANELAEMNHLICDVQSAVRSVVNINAPEKDSGNVTTTDSIEAPSSSLANANEKDNTDGQIPKKTEDVDEVTLDDSMEDIEVIRSKDSEEPPILDADDTVGSSIVSSESGVVTRRGRKRKVRSDVFSCSLCSFSGKKIVAHYVNAHLNSTIPAACIDQSAFDKLVEQNQSTSPQLFEISYKEENEEKPWPCLYCSERHDDVREHFEHLTTHTGEFMYGCAVCSIRHPYLKTMINHLKSHKLKEATGEVAKNLVTLYEPTVVAGGTELYAYMCNDCHYFQLLTDSIAHHLETENHSPSEAISIKFHGPAVSTKELEKKKEPFDKSVFLGTDEKITAETLQNSKRTQLQELTHTELEALQSEFLRLERISVREDFQLPKDLDDLGKKLCTEGGESYESMLSDFLRFEKDFDKSELDQYEGKTTTENNENKNDFNLYCDTENENEEIIESCKETLDWMIGIVESTVDPQVSFNIKLSSNPYDCDDLAKMIKQEQANNFRMDLSPSDSSEEEEDEIAEFGNQEFDFKEPHPLNRKTSVPVVSQYQYDLIVKLRNNKLFIVDKSWPRFQKYRNKVVLVARSGDGYEHSVLLHGFSVPIPATQEFPPPVVIPECEKLKMGLVGENRACIKDVEHYKNMLSPEKLKHLFKCMGKSCSYSGDSKNDFFQHLISHGMKNEDVDCVEHSEQNWICCSYCSLQYRKAEDLCNHIVHQHSKSLFQCGHCFYRSFWQSYIPMHYNKCHPTEQLTTIKCDTVAISTFVESLDMKLYVYRCSRDYCPDRSKQFLFRNDFMEHLKRCVPPGSSYICHMCYSQYKDHRHLVYHYKCHSIFRYQCFYCIYGSEEYSDMETHAFEIHPNLSGKIFDRQRERKGIQKNETSFRHINLLPVSNTLKKIEGQKNEPLRDSEEITNNRLGDYDSAEPEEKEGRVTNLEGTTLYRCANFRCNYTATNATNYKDHVVICDFMPEDKMISCFHCPKKVKSVFSLMEHIKIHGKQRQTCSLCPFKCCVNSELTKHFKNVHKVTNYRVSKSQENADEPEATVYPKETSLVLPEALQENFMLLSNKARFLPTDLDKIPTTSIFGSFVGCGQCTFTTKVRTNLLRHLKLHLQADLDGGETVVPTTAPVNPVPCLERNELMFDKMTNWAGSSHENKQGSGVTKEDAARLPQFIKEQFRYECSVPSCQQITVDDSMLRAHMKALHSEVDVYCCPHCHKDSSKDLDARNSVPIDKIGNHLKLHGPKLFRCGHCDYIHTQSRVMEKHVGEKHVEKKPIHYLIRNFDNDGNSSNRRTSVEDNPKSLSESWRCTLCAYKTQFSTWEDAKNHCTKHHNVSGQFSCSSCPFSTDYVFEITTHVVENKCTNPSVAAEKGRIMIAFCRNEALASLETKEESSTAAIWKRSTPGIKHIRGIFLEEGKESTQLSAKSDTPTKASTSAPPKSPAKAQGSVSAKNTNSPSKNTQKPGTMKNSSNINANNNSSKLLLSRPPSTTSTVEVKYYACTKCNKYKTKNTSDLIIHLHNEFNYRRYKCKLCDHKFITESSLKGHIVGDHQVSYNYSLCELLPTDPTVEEYVSKCIEEQQQEQPSKPASTNSNEPEGSFVREIHLKCKHCNMLFASHHNYRIHILAKHVAANRYSCKYCPLAFWNEGIAKQHHFRSTHASMPFAVVRNEELEAKLTPEFWLKEYGIPISKSLKYSAAGSTVLHCDQCIFKTNHPLKLKKHKDENHPITPAIGQHSSSENNGDSESPEIIDLTSTDLFASGSGSGNGSQTAKKPQKEKQSVYKCLHCKKNCFTAKGMRQHWLKYHSGHPSGLECSYYEFKCFTDSMQMLPGINLICPYCSHTENSIAGMRTHNVLRHPGQHFRMKRREFKETEILACDSCDFQGQTFTIIKKHCQLKHNTNLPLFTKIELTPVERICTPIGKLIEDKVMYGCTLCNCDYPSPYTFKRHIMDREGHMECDPNIKYNRCVIQENVEIPHDEQVEILISDEVYRCPLCSYETEDRNVMIQNHLATHIKTFICPLCDHGFEIGLDSLFHIRHHHHEPRVRPVSNKSAYLGFVALKDKIILACRSEGDSQVAPSSSTNLEFN